MSRQSFQSIHLGNLISERSLYLVPSGPTHFTESSSTCIDLAIVDCSSKVTSFFHSVAPIAAGHLAINLVYKFVVKKPNEKTIKFRDFHNCKTESLVEYVTGALVALFEQTLNRDPSQMVLDFNKILIDGLDIYAPFITRTFKRYSAPWMTSELRALCHERDSLYKQARRLGSHELLVSFRAKRRELKTLITRQRQEYLRDAISSSRDSSQIWKLLRKAGLTSDKNTQVNSNFSANELNDFYVSIASVHPPCSLEFLCSLQNSCLSDADNCFNFQTITQELVYDTACALLSKSKGQSPDQLPLKYLEKLLKPLLPFLVKLYNFSLEAGIYPSCWKMAFIIPLNKCSEPKSVSDTRPIANLCHLAKIFDKIIADQISCYLESYNLLSPFQSGFRSHHSTQTALLYLTDIIRNGIEHNMITLLVLFDFSKAFDTISHQSLLLSLKSLKFSKKSIGWIYSYITNRKQAVLSQDNQLSDFRSISSGVPQGSSPGPILFLILINSLPNILKFCKLSYVMFADDLQLFIQCPANLVDYAVRSMNQDIYCLENWAKEHGMQLNAQKTQAIIFGSRQNLTHIDNVCPSQVVVNAQPIVYVHQVKNLGVILSSDLTWNAHISSISSRVHGSLYKLRARAWLLSQDIKIQLIQSLVLPYIDYACLVYNSMPEYLCLKVQRLMNAGIRFIFNLRRSEHITPFRHELRWLTTNNRRKYFLARLAFSVIKTGRPIYLFEPLINAFGEVRRSARNDSCKVVIPNSRTTAQKQSFLVTVLEFWNSLPSAILESTSLNIFRSRVFEYLIELD